MNNDARTYRAYICFGPNCGPKGSSALLAALEAELTAAGLGDTVSVLPTGCQAHCESGPTMVVYPGPTYYQQVDAARLTRIVREHFAGGAPVSDYFWTGVRKRILPDGRKVIVSRPVPESPLNQAAPGRDRAPRPQKSPREVDDFKW
jgi:(2Fe-2S) ferredoxin